MHWIVRHGLLAAATVALMVGAARLAIDASGASFSGALSRLPLGRVLLGIGLYSLAHLLRVARMAMILGNSSLSLRRITQVQLFTAGVSLALPFKIGELFRVCELNHLVRDLGRSVLALWIVRQCTADMVLVTSPGNAYSPLLFFQRYAERLQGEVDAKNVFACPVEIATWRKRLNNWRRAARKTDAIRPNTIALVDREFLCDRLHSSALDELLASGMQAIGPAKKSLFLPELAPISPSGESGVSQRAIGAVRRWLFHEHSSKPHSPQQHSPQQHSPQQQVAPHRENHVRV